MLHSYHDANVARLPIRLAMASQRAEIPVRMQPIVGLTTLTITALVKLAET